MSFCVCVSLSIPNLANIFGYHNPPKRNPIPHEKFTLTKFLKPFLSKNIIANGVDANP